MYNIKAYIENLNRKLADIQLKYKEKQQTIDEVATVAMLGLDMVEKKIIREKENEEVLFWAEKNGGKYDEKTDLWYFPFTYEISEPGEETRIEVIDGKEVKKTYDILVATPVETYIAVKPSYVRSMSKNPYFDLSKYVYSEDTKNVRDMFNISISEYNPSYDKTIHENYWEPSQMPDEPSAIDVLAQDLYNISSKDMYKDDYGEDTIRTTINNEPAMINSKEAALVRLFGDEAENWLYNSWKGKVVDDPLDTSIQIRAYDDDGKLPWTSVASFALGGIQFLGGLTNKAREARAIKRHSKDVIAGIPGLKSTLKNLTRRTMEDISKTGEVNLDAFVNTLESIPTAATGQFNQALSGIEGVLKQGRGLVSGKSLSTVEDSLDLITRQAEQDRQSAFIQQQGINEQVAQQKDIARTEMAEGLEALDIEKEKAEDAYKKAKKQDRWWKNIF